MPDVNSLFEQLTQDAIKAAREGKWDQVIALYNRRISQGQLKHLSPEMSCKILKLDQWLVTRVREAQLAIQENLFEIQDKRRKLEILKRQWGGTSTAEARHLQTI
jgi:hypothetical protein